MAIDPSVLAVLREAVTADPENIALRLHLAETLAAAAEPGDALGHAEQVLAHQPDNLAALVVAAGAAAEIGDPKGEAYARLADALGAPSSSPASSEPDANAEPTHPAVPANTEPAHPVSPANDGGPVDAGDPDDPPRAPMGLGDPGEVALPATADDLIDQWADTAAPAEPEFGTLARPGMTLADVGGLADVKERLQLSFLAPLRNPELRERFGKSVRGGLMLWGPPGCGKTFMARAVAGELGAAFYEVGLADVLDMWIGSSERNLRSIFEVARRNAPCVLFFDEIDALGMKRTQLRQSGAAMRGVVNQLLSELDGVSTDNEGVFVLAATNHPWDVDPALVRPGRFDRKLLVLPPDAEARAAIFATHLRDKPVDEVRFDDLAKRTEGLSGADIALVCDQAVEAALMDSVRSGTIRSVTHKDLVAATKQVRPSTGPWFDTARNFATFNNEGGDYDDLIAYLGRRRR